MISANVPLQGKLYTRLNMVGRIQLLFFLQYVNYTALLVQVI